MKKIIAIILALCLTLTLCACAEQSNDGIQARPEITSNEPRQIEDQPEASSAETETFDTAEPETEVTTDEEAPVDGVDEPEAVPEEETGTKILVAYFSCTGTTEGLAEKIAAQLGADLYEIIPAEPYTDADLNYNDSSSRSTKEQNDSSCRPEILGSVENMDSYDTIILGYPIWWGQAPQIVYTFVESYDLSGKTIVPFCTSASSGVGTSATNLHNSASGANWLDGTRLSSRASDSDLESWLEECGLK